MSRISKPLYLGLLLSQLACNDAVDLNAATSEAFISGHAGLDAQCEFKTDRLVGKGLFDIARGADWETVARSNGCSQPYTLNLVVDSASDELVLFTRADVRMVTPASGATIEFPETERSLPNPYNVLVSGRIPSDKREGVITVDVIPTQYAGTLEMFVGEDIAVDVQLSGVQRSGSRVTTQTFRFPVAICKGCLVVCGGDLDESVTDEEIYGNACPDNTAADGRLCVDHACWR
jgi:hypothetical protein